MTYEELKVEASKLGYKLIKDEPLPRIKPCCMCGSKRISQQYTYVAEDNKHLIRKVCNCGNAGEWALTTRQMIESWNSIN